MLMRMPVALRAPPTLQGGGSARTARRDAGGGTARPLADARSIERRWTESCGSRARARSGWMASPAALVRRLRVGRRASSKRAAEFAGEGEEWWARDRAGEGFVMLPPAPGPAPGNLVACARTDKASACASKG
eukprot:scaffold1653_cov389-Prasinococcus_capsulatus_cf.AAC.9